MDMLSLYRFGCTGQQSIVKAVEENDTVVILGETGSGKTTRSS
jgi:HrpA-like RNA helicase